MNDYLKKGVLIWGTLGLTLLTLRIYLIKFVFVSLGVLNDLSLRYRIDLDSVFQDAHT